MNKLCLFSTHNECYAAVKNNEAENLYESIWSNFQHILSVKGSLQKSICSLLPFVQKRRKNIFIIIKENVKVGYLQDSVR